MSFPAEYLGPDGRPLEELPDGTVLYSNPNTGGIFYAHPLGHPECRPQLATWLNSASPPVRVRYAPTSNPPQQPAHNSPPAHGQSQQSSIVRSPDSAAQFRTPGHPQCKETFERLSRTPGAVLPPRVIYGPDLGQVPQPAQNHSRESQTPQPEAVALKQRLGHIEQRLGTLRQQEFQTLQSRNQEIQTLQRRIEWLQQLQYRDLIHTR